MIPRLRTIARAWAGRPLPEEAVFAAEACDQKKKQNYASKERRILLKNQKGAEVNRPHFGLLSIGDSATRYGIVGAPES